MNDLKKIVVLIDSDNTQFSKIADVLSEISTYGRIVVKRAYGNWRKDALKNWEPEIKRLAIKAVQQFDYVTGKNATDMALVIDTLELLHTNNYDAFVIVSSDSDYTPLAMKLHESGVYVMGVGVRTTPESFRNACDEFLFLENISADARKAPDEPGPAAAQKAPAGAASRAPGAPDDIEEIHALLRKAYDTYQDDDGYVHAGAAGSFLRRTKPDFDSRTYGYTKLTQFLAAFPNRYEIKRQHGKNSATVVLYKCLRGGKKS
ncbi:MAG: NYN domain-containing protein [Butyricicoccus sp.]|nr:NYN domain-containing protein [Butyricicoccus sp.]